MTLFPVEPSDDGFAAFWACYPRRVAKVVAQRAWGKLRPNTDTQQKILAAVEAQKRTKQWREGFIPYPATYINQERWLDEIESYCAPVSLELAPLAVDWFDDCKARHGGACGGQMAHHTKCQIETMRKSKRA